jgi:hypothetical protein
VKDKKTSLFFLVGWYPLKQGEYSLPLGLKEWKIEIQFKFWSDYRHPRKWNQKFND